MREKKGSKRKFFCSSFVFVLVVWHIVNALETLVQPLKMFSLSDGLVCSCWFIEHQGINIVRQFDLVHQIYKC